MENGLRKKGDSACRKGFFFLWREREGVGMCVNSVGWGGGIFFFSLVSLFFCCLFYYFYSCLFFALGLWD